MIEGVLKLIIQLVRQLYCRTYARFIQGRQYNCRPNNANQLVGSLTILAGISYGEILTWVLCID